MTQLSGPTNDFDRVCEIEDWGKYSRTGRISMIICSGADNATTFGQNVIEKKSFVKIKILIGLRDMHIWEVNPRVVRSRNCNWIVGFLKILHGWKGRVA